MKAKHNNTSHGNFSIRMIEAGITKSSTKAINLLLVLEKANKLLEYNFPDKIFREKNLLN